MTDGTDPAGAKSAQGSLGGVFGFFFNLAPASCGGPFEHPGNSCDGLVTWRLWPNNHASADIVALSQFLSVAASNEVGFAFARILFRPSPR